MSFPFWNYFGFVPLFVFVFVFVCFCFFGVFGCFTVFPRGASICSFFLRASPFAQPSNPIPVSSQNAANVVQTPQGHAWQGSRPVRDAAKESKLASLDRCGDWIEISPPCIPCTSMEKPESGALPCEDPTGPRRPIWGTRLPTRFAYGGAPL